MTLFRDFVSAKRIPLRKSHELSKCRWSGRPTSAGLIYHGAHFSTARTLLYGHNAFKVGTTNNPILYMLYYAWLFKSKTQVARGALATRLTRFQKIDTKIKS